MLDVEVVGAIVPQANMPSTCTQHRYAGFLNAITTAVHDTNQQALSYFHQLGGPESSWTTQAMTAMDDAFQAAAPWVSPSVSLG